MTLNITIYVSYNYGPSPSVHDKSELTGFLL